MKGKEFLKKLEEIPNFEELEIVGRIPHCCGHGGGDERSWFFVKPEKLTVKKEVQRNPWDVSHTSYYKHEETPEETEEIIAIVSPVDIYF